MARTTGKKGKTKTSKPDRKKATTASKSKLPKMVYFFGGGKAEGRGDMKELLGGKGAGLAEMTNARIPVPPGFTITCEACKLFYDNGMSIPEGLGDEIRRSVAKLEKITGKNFGGSTNPLLVSVRSGAPLSMPGMMDTVLNLGMNN
jgi:pyruvate,orthophosphate dikinase